MCCFFFHFILGGGGGGNTNIIMKSGSEDVFSVYLMYHIFILCLYIKSIQSNCIAVLL